MDGEVLLSGCCAFRCREVEHPAARACRGGAVTGWGRPPAYATTWRHSGRAHRHSQPSYGPAQSGTVGHGEGTDPPRSVRIREAARRRSFLGSGTTTPTRLDGKDDMAKTTGTGTRSGGSGEWTAEERAAMKEHAVELKRTRGKGAAKAAEETQA